LSSRGRSFDALTRDWWSGWRFSATPISEAYPLDKFYDSRGEDVAILLIKRTDGTLEFVQPGTTVKIDKGTLLSYSPKSSDAPETVRDTAPSTFAGPATPLPG
jgi:hypothetical protein